ncbi:LAGLIDADG family homing endonuclease [Bacillus cereus group sp. BceL174]|uniref:LAGLIDADG family homing endonuclease n=1 Tax=Bacillus cereus group sp. BceL174 TaxID=3445055 RepID=UPI003F25C602
MAKLKKEDHMKILEGYKKGEKVKKMAEKYSVSETYIYHLLKKYGVETVSQEISQRKYSLDIKKFKKIETEETAYTLGFLGADGYNNEERGLISIHLKREDEPHLAKLNEVFGSNNPIKRTTSGNSFNQKKSEVSYIRMYSKTLSKQLAKWGIVQAKTHKYEFPYFLDEKLLRHYLRGYIDGDGCFSSKKRNRFSFIGPRTFCEEVINFLKKENVIETYKEKKYKEKGYVSINVYGIYQIKRLIHFLYDDSTIYLERKKQIVDEIIESIDKKEEEKNQKKICIHCEREAVAKKMCLMHYKRVWKKQKKEI